MVRALSMPRPAYIAAHSPAGPAPTMITSYPCLALSVIRPQLSVRTTQLQARRLGIAGERPRQLLAKSNGLDFDIGPLWALQLLEGRSTHHRHTMPIPPLLMEQRGRRLDQALPNACRVLVAVTNNRTPDGFQGLVGGPVVAGIEQTARPRHDRLTLCGCHGRQRAAEGGRGGKETPTAAPCRPLPPLPPRSAASSPLHDSSRSSPPEPPPPSRSRPRPAPSRRLRSPRLPRRCRRRTRDGGTRTMPAHALVRPPAHRIPHLPRPRAPDGRADGGLDAVRGTDPVGERDIPSTVGSRPIVRRPRLAGHGSDVDGAPRPSLARVGHEPLEHEVRHERRGHDVILRPRRRAGGSAQELTEIVAPLADHERPVLRLAQLPPRATGRVTIDNHDAPEVRLASLLGLGELPRLERPVAPATDDHDVAHGDRFAHA